MGGGEQKLVSCRFPLSTVVGILPCRRYKMDSTLKVADICCGGRKQSRLNNGKVSSGPSKSLRRDGMDQR